jgi:predicted NAD/FAD-binding protein
MRSGQKRIAVIGGGAAGASLLWCLTSQDLPGRAPELTLFHDEAAIGGHSRTIPVWFDASGVGSVDDLTAPRTTYPVDIGVQFVCPSIYPNLYRQLRLPGFERARLKRHPALRMAGAFRDDLNWGNFAEYQRGERFSRCFDAETRATAARFERDLHRAPFVRVHGRPAVSLTVDEWLTHAGYRRDSNFFRYLLIPYLCVINGYGTVDLLETKLEDLFPIFTKLPGLQDEGPYGSFIGEGHGWDRFELGATEWVRSMVDLAVKRGAKVRLAAPVRRLERRGDEWLVIFGERAVSGRGFATDLDEQQATHAEAFDEVVLTTDMVANRALLDHPRNPYWKRQRAFLAPERFALLPGVCYIHQDEEVLAPSMRDGKEDGQFTGYFAWGERDQGSDLYGLPYDLGASFQTYSMQNILGTPAPCYVSMYAEDRVARVPDPKKTLFVRAWRHGRWVASFFRDAKRELHRVQGLGGVWYAGNNTTVDSEEGALISAMVIAERMAGWRYPFPRVSSAYLMYSHFREQMFPLRTGMASLQRILLGA